MTIFGNKVRITATVTVDSVATAPTTETFTLIAPNGTEQVLTPDSNPSTGVYVYSFTPTMPGRYDYRMVTTGTVESANEGFEEVPKSRFYP